MASLSARKKPVFPRFSEYDDDLKNFEAHGAAPLPVASDQGCVDHHGARIWYATYGSGSPVILLHGGLGHSGNWGYQVPMLVSSGHRTVLVDSRGHGRSTRDLRPFTYELMASDVLAVMDALRLEKAAFVGWSDGACTSLVLAGQAPARVAGVFFFACTWIPADQPFSPHRSSTGASPGMQGLFRAVRHARSVQGLCRCGRPDAEDGTELFRERSGQYPCARRDRAKRA